MATKKSVGEESHAQLGSTTCPQVMIAELQSPATVAAVGRRSTHTFHLSIKNTRSQTRPHAVRKPNRTSPNLSKKSSWNSSVSGVPPRAPGPTTTRQPKRPSPATTRPISDAWQYRDAHLGWGAQVDELNKVGRAGWGIRISCIGAS